MKNRLQSIVYQLAFSEVPLTAQDIAGRLALSLRTIKSELKNLKKEISEIGATLIARRNQGYSLQIDDPIVFQTYIEQLSLKINLVNNYAMDDMTRFLYIARKLISSSRYIKIDDIADELYISRSSLRQSIKDAMDFLSSYHMITESKPGLGIRTYGTEYHARVAMMELFAIHFHKAQLNDIGMEYAKWLDCDKKERQDIRHNFLHTLVNSKLSILDIYTQRLSIYFIIARNRMQSGHQMRIPTEWVEEIQQYREYEVANEIFTNLSEAFKDFEVSKEEIAFLGILLLCNRDVSNIKSSSELFPTLYDEVLKHVGKILNRIKKVHNLGLRQFDWVEEALVSMFIPFAARVRFAMEGGAVLNEHYDKQTSESPLALDMSRTIAEYLKEAVNKDLPEISIIHKISNFIYKILFWVDYDIKKRKLLLVSYDGICFTDYARKRLMGTFGTLIESCTCVELYEVRAMDQSKYDAVIMGNPEAGYNYDLPRASMLTVAKEGEIGHIYNMILNRAYQFDQYLPKPENIYIYTDFLYDSEADFFCYLSKKHCKKKVSQEKMKEALLRREKIVTYRNRMKSVIIVGIPFFHKEELVELYFLDKPGIWSGKEVNCILYTNFDCDNNPKKAKAMENSLCQLALHPEYFDKFRADKTTAFQQLIYESLKI